MLSFGFTRTFGCTAWPWTNWSWSCIISGLGLGLVALTLTLLALLTYLLSGPIHPGIKYAHGVKTPSK